MTDFRSDRFVADTQALFWLLIDSPRLSPAANAAFRLVEAGLAELWLPTIVLVELVHLARKQRLTIRLEDLVQDQRLGSVVHIAELDLPILREFELLEAPSEIHDRLIVASARILGAPLITSDIEIRAGGNIQIIW